MEKKKLPIWTRVSPEIKKEFHTLAKSYQMSESCLLAKLVEKIVQTHTHTKEQTSQIEKYNHNSAASASGGLEGEEETKTEKLSTRITYAEWEALNAHIRRRGITVSIFLRLLLHAYMTGGPAFDSGEVAALREANLAVAKVGRLLNQGVKELATNPYADPERALPEKMLRDLAEEVSAVRKRVESLLRANTQSWAVVVAEQKGGGRR